MIWDRFDDAHDELLGEIRESEREIADLKAKLRAAGISFDPYEKPEPRNEPGPQGWYEDTVREAFALDRYADYLKERLTAAGDGKT